MHLGGEVDRTWEELRMVDSALAWVLENISVLH